MKASALLILLLLPSLALAQQQYYGTTASAIDLPAPADKADASRLALHTGEVITPENIRDSIRALYATGHYRTISVDAVPETGGTRLTFLVTAQYYFSTFRLEPDNLLERPITSYFQPPIGKKFSTAPVERLVDDTKKLIEEAGYFNATIQAEYTPDDKTRLMAIVLRAAIPKDKAKIKDIRIAGEESIFPGKVLLDEMKLSRGDDYNATKLSKDVTRIRQKFVDKGYLTAKVQVAPVYAAETNTVDLEITIDPGQTTIVRVFETGTTKSEIPDDKLRTLVPIFEEGTVDADLMEEGRQHIVGYYKQLGYFDADATAQRNDSDDTVQILYIVDKGVQHRVRTLRIQGSAFFPESDILKKLKTKEGKTASHGVFSPELLAGDIGTIESMYRNAGFRSTEVHFTEEQSLDHNIDITIQIHEGLRSTLGDVTFTGNHVFTEPQLWRESGIQTDQVYSAAIIDNARDALAAFYYSKGFSEIRIDTHIEFDPVYNTVGIRFDIQEGAQYRIGWILVSGNTHTAEKIITRGSGLKADDPYNPEKVLEAQQKLYELGLFARVEIVAIDQDLGALKNLLIQVEDSKPILLTPGVGITELEGPRATLELSDNNLFGLGRSANFRIRGGRRERQLQSSYREPHLLNHDLQGIASVSFDKSDRRFFTSNEVALSLQVVRKFSKTRSLSFLASYQTVNLQDIKVNPNARRFPDATGVIQIARLGTSFIGDRRDNIIDPSHGIFTTTNFQVANKHYGSEVNFISLFNQTSYYRPLHGGVIATSFTFGLNQPYGGDKELPISERYFAGGSTTLRGFKLDAAGPPGGGQLKTIGNLEYRFPLNFLPVRNFYGAVFYDTGNVFERPSDFALNRFTHTAGTGLRYKTPLGPIRVDVGFNLRAKENDKKYRVFFTLEHAF